ncbi:MAG: YbhB/YbcL family Raf kinase inhibitor-like protein, partial [Candidatus Moraniibacteriota bacterium]
LMEDPDSPGGMWIHWRLWNIDPKTTAIKEASVPTGAIQGVNTFGRAEYGGPCPHRGEHIYIFRIYALKGLLHIPPEASDLMFRNALIGNTIAEADLVGYYRRAEQK